MSVAIGCRLQVITAMCDSFSHGANDVANAVGPFCAIWYIYNNMRVRGGEVLKKPATLV